MSRISPFLWFDDNAEEAVKFYLSVFRDAEVLEVSRYGEEGPGPAGQVMVMRFRLGDTIFQALNGGPVYSFTPAISFLVDCVDQVEVDHLWTRLSEGGEPMQCGWIRDRFGVTWQIVPTVLGDLMSDPDPEVVGRVTAAMLQMVKLDVAALEAAARGQG